MTTPLPTAAALAALTDDALLAATAQAARGANQATARLLAHLAEVDRRKLYRDRAFPSMHAWCTGHLGLSDAAAYRRIEAARLVRRFPVALEWFAEGRLHLTALTLLKNHLTEANHRELLEAAFGQRKDDIQRLLAERFPQPERPDRLRKLPERRVAVHAPALPLDKAAATPEPPAPDAEIRASAKSEAPRDDEAASPAPAPAPRPEPQRRPATLVPTGPARFVLTVTLDAETHACLEQLQALMCHRRTGQSLGGIVSEALRQLRDRVEKERFGSPRGRKAKPKQPKQPKQETGRSPSPSAGIGTALTEGADDGTTPARDPATPPPAEAGRTAEPPPAERGAQGSRRRPVPLPTRREVFDRDGARCTFRDPKTGRRCASRRVQTHHEESWCLGGSHDPDNLSLRCKAHNDLAAERDLGPVAARGRARAEAARRARTDRNQG